MGFSKRDASTLNPGRRGQDAPRQWFDHIAGEARGGEMAMTHREGIAGNFECLKLRNIEPQYKTNIEAWGNSAL
jgi:hypothetical protein